MSARGKIPPTFEGRSVQGPGILRHGSFPGLNGGPASRHPMEPHSRSEIAEKQMALQEAEIEQLAGENHKLAATHVPLREELAIAQEEIQKLKAHIRSIQTESDIQMRLLLEKIAKMGADIQAGEVVKKDLQQAHVEARSLVATRQELTSQIQRATQELQRTRNDVKKLPDLHAELDSLQREHQRLRTKFEYEKRLNIEQVEKMQVMEKNMVDMAQEVEKLQAEVLNAENKARLPHYGGPYVHPDPSYLPAHGNAAYVDGYGRPYPQMGIGAAGDKVPYSTTNGPANASGVAAMPASASGNAATWAGAYDPSAARR